MQLSVFHEILQLFFNFCNKNSILFISIFDFSKNLIAFNYSINENRFTNFSNSFESILGYNLTNVLHKGKFESTIVHPQDRHIFQTYLNNTLHYDIELLNFLDLNPSIRSKFRARHARGYWKYFIMFSLNYKNNLSNKVEKIGVFAKEHTKVGFELTEGNENCLTNKSNISNKSLKLKNQIQHRFLISKREFEILELVSKGMIAREIANELNISLSTVTSHRQNLIEKLNANNAAELVAKAYKLALI